MQERRGIGLKSLQNMKPQISEHQENQYQLYKTRLESFLNRRHALFVLSHQIDWAYFEQAFGATFSDRGRPGLPTRLMVALSYLKHSYNLSDEGLVEGFLENAYWQYFCGFEYFQHEFPCDASSLTRWRKRLGEEGIKKLLSETLRLAHRKKLLKGPDLQEVIVDTTVQEKNITHPTDAKLLHRARMKLVKAAKRRGIVLRQSYERVGKLLAFQQGKYAHAKQYKRARRATKRLKTLLGRVYRDIARKCLKPDPQLKNLMILSRRLLFQNKHTPNKLYSLHEPDVECLAKGKAHKPYEFGCKTSVISTAGSIGVIGVKSFHGRPYDGHTLKAALQDAEENTSVEVQRVFADQGYRGSRHWPAAKQVLISGRKRLPKRLKKLLKRRSAIEPIIGHMKSEHRFSRNLLKGRLGDQLNALLAGTGFNFRKLIRYFGSLPNFFRWLLSHQGMPEGLGASFQFQLG